MVGQGRIAVLRKKFNCAVTPLTAADVIQVFDLAPGTLVLCTGLRCTVAEGAAATIDMGDEVDPNGFIAAANVNLATTDAIGAGAFAIQTTGGKYYAAADTLDIIPSATLGLASFEVWAVVVLTGDPA